MVIRYAPDDGFENDGTNVVFRKNRLTGNLQDLSGTEESSLIDEGGNTFKTGAADAPPITDN